MKTTRLLGTLAVAAATALSAPAFASPPQIVSVHQPATEPAQAAMQGETIPAGASFRVQLLNGISTQTTPPGMAFSANVLTPVYDSKGRAVVPVGSQLSGHVASATHSGMYRGHATIALAVDSLNILGTFVPIDARISGQASLQRKRSGIFLRQNASLPAGSSLLVELQRPLSVSQLATASRLTPPVEYHYHYHAAPLPAVSPQPAARGGGPRMSAPRHRAHAAVAPAQRYQACAPCQESARRP